MAWEVLAIWAIVSVTIVWFIGDERRQRASTRRAYTAPYRHIPVTALERGDARPQHRAESLSHNQRAFIAALTTPQGSA